MRSRDGNCALSCKFCTLIFFFSLALDASEYLISYRYVVKDTILYNETLQISQVMQACKGVPQESLTLPSNGTTNITKIIHAEMEDFVAYVHKLGMSVKHKEKNSNYQNKSTIIMTMHTTCFKVDFNDNFAKITPLK
jgi:hypothetical protein